jgi:hypothetical protein
VDGRRVRPFMVAPALVGVVVPPGTHAVAFRYQGFTWYPELVGVCALALWVLRRLDTRSRASRSVTIR